MIESKIVSLLLVFLLFGQNLAYLSHYIINIIDRGLHSIEMNSGLKLGFNDQYSLCS